MKIWIAATLLLSAPPGGFRWERPVLPGAAGANRLDVDLPLLSHAEPGGGLADLRLFDSSGREVPYLLVAPEEPSPEAVWRDGRLVPIRATHDESGFELDLGAAVAVNRLRVELAAPFLKRLRLEGSGDRRHWVSLVAEGTLFDLPEEGLAEHALGFPPGAYRYLRLTWDDRSSGRVPMPSGAQARLSESSGVPPPARLAVSIPFERRPSAPAVSLFRLHLPAERLPIVALDVACGEAHLLRRADVTEQRFGDSGCAGPTRLGSATLRRVRRGDLAAEALGVPIRAPHGATLDLVVQNGDNPPLDLTSVTAEVAPQPWIYFEASDGKPLVARFGNGKLTSPRYDLEAVRGSLEQRHPAAARWGDVAALAPTSAVVAAAPAPEQAAAAGAPLSTEGFGYAREISPGPAGLTAVALDAAVLAHARGHSDLRIVQSPGGAQVPYLVESLNEPLALDLTPRLSTNGPPSDPGGPPPAGQSAYVVELPYPGLPEATLVVATSARVFERRVALAIERAPDSPPRTPPLREIESRVWSHADPDAPASDLSLDVPSQGGTRLWLLVDEGDNRRLPLSGVRLLLPASRLRFFRAPGASLRLLYGKPDLAPPRYDLALLAPALMEEAVQEATLGPEAVVAPSSAAGAPAQTKIFWAALSGAVVVLLGFLAQLLKKPAS